MCLQSEIKEIEQLYLKTAITLSRGIFVSPHIHRHSSAKLKTAPPHLHADERIGAKQAQVSHLLPRFSLNMIQEKATFKLLFTQTS